MKLNFTNHISLWHIVFKAFVLCAMSQHLVFALSSARTCLRDEQVRCCLGGGQNVWCINNFVWGFTAVGLQCASDTTYMAITDVGGVIVPWMCFKESDSLLDFSLWGRVVIIPRGKLSTFPCHRRCLLASLEHEACSLLVLYLCLAQTGHLHSSVTISQTLTWQLLDRLPLLDICYATMY